MPANRVPPPGRNRWLMTEIQSVKCHGPHSKGRRQEGLIPGSDDETASEMGRGEDPRKKAGEWEETSSASSRLGTALGTEDTR